MEMELGPFTFPELMISQTPTYSKALSAEILSSLLDLDDIYTPPPAALPEQLQDVYFLDNFQQFALPDFEPDALSLIPQQEEEEYSLLDFDPATEFLAETPATTAEPTTTYVAHDLLEEADSSDGLFNDDDLCLIAPDESYESFFQHVLEIASPDVLIVNPQISPTTNHGEAAEEEEEEEEEEDDDDEEELDNNNYLKRSSSLNSKNLFSERNRRKRLSQQLLALRSLVPNITKMDKRSVLVDALAYLKSMHEEIARIRKERSSSSLSSKHNHQEPELPDDTPVLLPKNYPKTKPLILEIDTEKIEDRRFVVKITCKGGAGVGGELLRVMESLGFEITYTALDQIKPMHILTTVFIRVRKQGRMTEEKLKDYITSSALRSGLLLQNP